MCVLLSLYGIEHGLLLLRRYAALLLLFPAVAVTPVIVGFLPVPVTVTILILVVLILILVLILVLVLILILVLVLVVLILILVLVLILVLIVLLLVEQALGVGVVVLRVHVRGVQTQRVAVTFERLFEFLLHELRVAEVVESLGPFGVGTGRIRRRAHHRLFGRIVTFRAEQRIAQVVARLERR